MEVVPCIVIIPIQLYGSGTVYSHYTDTVVWKWYRVYIIPIHGSVSHYMEVVPCIVIIPIQLYGSGTVYSHYTDTVVWKWYRV